VANVLRADIVEPLGLRSTTMVGGGPAPANLVHGYVQADGGVVDVAYAVLHSGSGSGGVISTMKDLNTFYTALLRGELLSPAGLMEMKGRVYADYGLGLDHWHDRCTNGIYNGHGGDVAGYGSIAISSADGNRQLAIAVAYPPSPLLPQPNGIALELPRLAGCADGELPAPVPVDAYRRLGERARAPSWALGLELQAWPTCRQSRRS
jgi:D-alanyl-D-alanine carboxypeptidase